MPRDVAVRRHFGRVLLAALTLGGASLAVRAASADIPPVAMRFADPPPVALDATSLGRASHRVHLVVQNKGTRPVSLASVVLDFTAVRDGIAYACEADQREERRWPRALAPREAIEIRQGVTCDTPFPGRYEVEVRARTADEPEEAARAVGAFTVSVEPGTKAPVQLPWEPRLFAVASGTKEIRPGSGERTGARVIVALVNGTPRDVTLTATRAVVRVLRQDDGARACPDHAVDLTFHGTLAPGRSQAIGAPVPCNFTTEGTYDVIVTLVRGGDRVALPRHTVRVAAVATPPQPPAGGIIGGR